MTPHQYIHFTFTAGLFLITYIIKGVHGASYCTGYYAQACEHGCCGTGCCYNKVSLALGLIFGLIGLILLCSGAVICFIQYVYKRKKTVTTRDSIAQTGDATTGTVMKPTPIPPMFLRQKKLDKEKKSSEVKVSLQDAEEETTEKKQT